VIFTGGGTLGHVVPNLAVIEEFIKRSRKHEILYIGAKNGPEKEAVNKFAQKNALKNLQVREIICGKLRRYFSFKNFIDAFKVPIGIIQSVRIINKFKPHIVFSKGGFVGVHVVVGCALVNFKNKIFKREAYGEMKIHIFIHESDVEMGLSNKISCRFADKIFVSFEETKRYFGKRSVKTRRDRIVVSGNPIRAEILKGSKENGLKLCGFHRFKPVILVMGGSLGSMQVNKLTWNNLDKLLGKFQVAHIVGKGNLDFGLKKQGYKQFELLFDELKDVYAASDVVVSRGGANSLAEIASLEKMAVIIPLNTVSSRGDQITNAKVCAEEYGWQVLYSDVSDEQFLRAIDFASSEKFKGGNILHKKASKIIVDLMMEI